MLSSQNALTRTEMEVFGSFIIHLQNYVALLFKDGVVS